jgi:hypothetical protein
MVFRNLTFGCLVGGGGLPLAATCFLHIQDKTFNINSEIYMKKIYIKTININSLISGTGKEAGSCECDNEPPSSTQCRKFHDILVSEKGVCSLVIMDSKTLFRLYLFHTRLTLLQFKWLIFRFSIETILKTDYSTIYF